MKKMRCKLNLVITAEPTGDILAEDAWTGGCCIVDTAPGRLAYKHAVSMLVDSMREQLVEATFRLLAKEEEHREKAQGDDAPATAQTK